MIRFIIIGMVQINELTNIYATTQFTEGFYSYYDFIINYLILILIIITIITNDSCGNETPNL
jgi:hypothetical protein